MNSARSLARRAYLQKSAGFSDVMSGISKTMTGSGKYPFDPGLLQRLAANEDVRRALLGALVGGTTAALSSDDHKLRNGLIGAGVGGLGTYGVSASGALDNIPNKLRPYIADAKAREFTWRTHGKPQVTQQDIIEYLKRMRQQAPQQVA